MLVMLVLATHVTVARAGTGTFTTAITSPADPSCFYAPTDGPYGDITDGLSSYAGPRILLASPAAGATDTVLIPVNAMAPASPTRSAPGARS